MIQPEENGSGEPQQISLQDALQMAMQSTVGYAKAFAKSKKMKAIYIPMVLEFESKGDGEKSKGFCLVYTGSKTDGLYGAMSEAAEKYLKGE